MSDEEKKLDPSKLGTEADQTGATLGAGDGKDGAGNDGDLTKESPTELARIIAELCKKTRRPARSSANSNMPRHSSRNKASSKRPYQDTLVLEYFSILSINI